MGRFHDGKITKFNLRHIPGVIDVCRDEQKQLLENDKSYFERHKIPEHNSQKWNVNLISFKS